MRRTQRRDGAAGAWRTMRALALIAMGGCIFEPSRGGGGGWVDIDAGTPGCAVGAAERCACAGGAAGQRRCQPGGVWGACACGPSCAPQCAGRVCGDDGCGGVCGACAGDGRCEGGRCVAGATTGPCPQRDLGSALGLRVAQGTTAAGTSQHAAPCATESGAAYEATFGWTAPRDGRFTFTTEGSSFDTVLTVRDGGCDGASLACEDDSAGLAQQSRVSLELRAGQRVTVVVDGFDAMAVGLYALSIEGTCAPRCAGRACGDDGCGGTCGTCPTGATCGAGVCVAGAGTDPCGGISSGGRCLGATRLERCAVSSGGATPRRETITCGAGEVCREAEGEARCVLTAVCRDGATRCAGTALQRCVGGQWTAGSCNGVCMQTAVGAECVVSATGTRAYSGRLRYHARSPNRARTAWESGTFLVNAQGFLVVSVQGGAVLDTAVTTIGQGEDGGRFTLRVPNNPGPNDGLRFVAAQADARGQIQLAVALRGLDGTNSPSLPEGCTALTRDVRRCDVDAENPAQRPAVWSWSMAGAQLPSDGLIEILPGYSEAARLFDWARYVFNRAGQTLYGRDGASLVVWFTPGVKWTCGNCANLERYEFPTASGEPLNFETQIWMSGGPEGIAWSNAVVTHELGHWMMDSYGRNPGEGGQHFAGEPVFPGMAWSEGWATFHNADARQDAEYISVQSSNDRDLTFSMWGLNLDNRAYSLSGARWSRPAAGAGLYQRVDENEVAALLWRLSRTSRGNTPIYNAMAAPRTRAPNRTGEWERGYTVTRWSTTASGIDLRSVRDTNLPAPMFADFLDALRCNGFPATDIDAVLVPATYYPYPSGRPLCRP